ncbi:MAG: hypothetical protein ABI534_08645 [Chloroflexota bacterium]
MPKHDARRHRRAIVLTPQEPAAGKPRLLSGTFGADAIEGGCAYLEIPAGIRHEVLYPLGWKLLRHPVLLLNPDGDIVARGGETVVVRGSQAPEMVSTCQAGPIFRAVEVVSITPASDR